MPAAAQLADVVTNYDFFCSESEQLTLANGIMGGRRGSIFLRELDEKILANLWTVHCLANSIGARWVLD